MPRTSRAWLRPSAHGSLRRRPGDYFAVQAFLAPGPYLDEALHQIRRLLRNRLRNATTVGYGPRFLHSTGQLHKGGPDTGLFLQLVDNPRDELPVPESDFTFRTLISAQAAGDWMALKQRGRRVLRVDVGRQAMEGLSCVAEVLHG